MKIAQTTPTYGAPAGSGGAPVGINLGTIQGSGKFLPGGGDGTSQITSLISTIVGFLTITAGIMFFIFFMIGGITWITASGDASKIKDSQNKMTGAAIGMIIIVVAYAITSIIGEILGIDVLDLNSAIQLITFSSTP